MEIDYHNKLRLNEKSALKIENYPENCSIVTSPSRKLIRENSDRVEMKYVLRAWVRIPSLS